jgi:hypothetical protein
MWAEKVNAKDCDTLDPIDSREKVNNEHYMAAGLTTIWESRTTAMALLPMQFQVHSTPSCRGAFNRMS